MARHDSGDRIEILWDGGITAGIYADHRNGGRVIVTGADGKPVLMNASEFGKRSVRGGVGEMWGTPLDVYYDELLAAKLVDDTTDPIVASAQREVSDV